ncbi:MAG: phage tail assembly protein [Chloroflexaceae bacterium]|nr:phage tail assembly protein [Chloroflexaceae bacterium]
MLQTEFAFTLPCGYVDEQGNLHRQGIMRRATTMDEVEPLGDPRVRANEAYLVVLLLGRVVTRLGTLNQPGPALIERLFSTDFSFLQELYERINTAEGNLVETQCPTCGTRFVLNLDDAHG